MRLAGHCVRRLGQEDVLPTPRRWGVSPGVRRGRWLWGGHVIITITEEDDSMEVVVARIQHVGGQWMCVAIDVQGPVSAT